MSDTRGVDSLDDDPSENDRIAALYGNVKASLRRLNSARQTTYTQQLAIAVDGAIPQLDKALADKDKHHLVRFKGFLDSLLQTIDSDYEDKIEHYAQQTDPVALQNARNLIRDLRRLYRSL